MAGCGQCLAWFGAHRVSGGVVVVTGAASGIGAACVRSFRATGVETVGVDVSLSSDADHHVDLDLARADCGTRLGEVIEGLEVTGLVNNAAVSADLEASDAQADDFDRAYQVNLRAPLLVAGALYERLRKSRGWVVNIASVHALATSKNVSIYAATKGGLVAMTRALAVEWAPEVRVNAVVAGAVDSPMLRSGLDRTRSTVNELATRHPLQRVGTPEQIAEAVLYLARAEFVTGSALTIDGGALAHLSTE